MTSHDILDYNKRGIDSFSTTCIAVTSHDILGYKNLCKSSVQAVASKLFNQTKNDILLAASTRNFIKNNKGDYMNLQVITVGIMTL